KLTLAQSVGEVRLVLRPHDDDARAQLPPLENLDTDGGAGDLFGGPKTLPPPPATFKLAVAKLDMEAGATIDDPAKYFEVKSFATVPEKAIPGEELASLKGKTLKTPVFKETILTAKHFDEKMATVVMPAAKPEPKRHLLFIQNGGNAPQVTTYLDGAVVRGAGARGTLLSDVPEGQPKEQPKPEPPAPPAKDN